MIIRPPNFPHITPGGSAIRGLLLCVAVTISVVTFTGCGGDTARDATILHFNDQDVSEESYRAFLRSAKTGNLIAWQIVCKDLDGLSNQAALSYFRNDNPKDDISPVAGATPKPGQKRDERSVLRAAAIFQEECKR